MGKRSVATLLTLAMLGLAACSYFEPTATLAELNVTALPLPADADLGSTWIRAADGMEMVYVPGGEFEMGSDDDDMDYAMQLCREDWGDDVFCELIFDDEQPVHTVALNGFWIDRTEVTNIQYRRCVQAGVCQKPRPEYEWETLDYYDTSKENHPVGYVTWDDAQTYCEWAGARLPTEAEWEYAARGPQGSTYPWGEDAPTCELAQISGCNGIAPVGSLPRGASWCGALDMAGNVSEWLADRFAVYQPERQVNPIGRSSKNDSHGMDWVLRGGNRCSNPYTVRSAYRWVVFRDELRDHVGFRCAKSSK